MSWVFFLLWWNFRRFLKESLCFYFWIIDEFYGFKVNAFIEYWFSWCFEINFSPVTTWLVGKIFQSTFRILRFTILSTVIRALNMISSFFFTFVCIKVMNCDIRTLTGIGTSCTVIFTKSSEISIPWRSSCTIKLNLLQIFVYFMFIPRFTRFNLFFQKLRIEFRRRNVKYTESSNSEVFFQKQIIKCYRMIMPIVNYKFPSAFTCTFLPSISYNLL